MIRRISKLMFPAILWWAAVHCFGSVAFGQETLHSPSNVSAVPQEPIFPQEIDGRVFEDRAAEDDTIAFDSSQPVDSIADPITDRSDISLEIPPSTVVSPQSSYERKQSEEIYERVLDLEPNGQNRALIERVRQAVEETEVGVDVTDEEWVHVKDMTKITWGGMIQGDWVNWADDSEFTDQPNYVEFRRLRLFAKGEGYGVYDYEMQLEFSPENDLEADVVDNRVDLGGFGVEIKDVYVGIRDNPYLGYIRAGHFKVPVSLSQLTSAKYTPFIERELPSRLTPGRELGLGANQISANQRLTLAWGVFFDELDEASHRIEGDHQGVRLAGRITWTPYYDELSEGRHLFHTGLSYAYTRPRQRTDPLNPQAESRPVRFTARPEIHVGDNLLDTGEINTDHYSLLDLEMAWVKGRFSLQSELVYTSLAEIGPDSTELFGAYVLGSYFLTGEHRTYDRQGGVFGGVTPFENFWMVDTPSGCRKGWGAWELAMRWSYLDFSDVDGQQLHDLTAGVNWYWNPQTRMMFNWIHPFARNTLASPVHDPQGDIVAMRLQVDF